MSVNNKKIKLLHLHAPLRFGGGEVFLSNFYQKSKPWFVNKTILFGYSADFNQRLKSLDVGYSVFYPKDLKIGSMKKYLSVLLYSVTHLFYFRKIFVKYCDTDFIVGHGFPFVVFIPIIKFIGLVPKTTKIVHFQHHRLRRPSVNKFWRFIYNFLLCQFDTIIVDSIQVQNDIIKHIPVVKEKIYIIGAGLPFTDVREVAYIVMESSRVVQILRAKKNGVTVAIYASRFVPHKNHEIFKKILLQIRAFNLEKKFLLVLTGEEILTSSFREFVIQNKFEDCLCFTGSIEHNEVFYLMSLSDVCLFPSLEEGFGLSILECLVFGLPTVVFGSAIPEELHQFLICAKNEEDFIMHAVDLIKDQGQIVKEKNKLISLENQLMYFDIAHIAERLYVFLNQTN